MKPTIVNIDKNLNRNTSMKKLSAFEQAQQFSVDEDDTICSIEDVEYDNLESTSWAYVASQKIETKEEGNHQRQHVLF